MSDPEEAYMAGLVHCIGEAYLALNHTARFQQVYAAAKEKGLSIAQAIEQEFGVSHAAVCGKILRSWKMSESICEAVEHQGTPEDAPNQKTLAGIIHAADCICRDLGLGPADPSKPNDVWVTLISPTILDLLGGLGYPDVTYYLMDQQLFLKSVAETVRSTFSKS